MSDSFGDWLSSESVVDLAIAVIAVEALVVLVLRRRAGAGHAYRGALANVVAGAFLIVALRLAVAGAGWPMLALLLAGAGAAHAAELVLRRRRP